MSAPDDRLRSVALDYRDNHRWVPIRLKGKSPDCMGKGWQKRTLADPIPDFEQGDNVGFLLGTPSDSVVRLDPDFEAIDAVTDLLFPEPTAVSSRKSSPRSGRFYICHGLKTTNFKLPNAMKDDQRLPLHDGKSNVTVFQILSTGAQTMAPPSIHPESGEDVVWDNAVEPRTIDQYELLRRVGIESFCMVARHFWPPRGSRNEAAMAMARVLLETFATSIADDDERIAIVDEIVEAVATAGGDGVESLDGKARAARTLEKMRAGEEATGLSTLLELLELPEKTGKLFRKWLGLSGIQTSAVYRSTASGLSWRERFPNGQPKPSLENARVAIVTLGVECRKDLFHDKLLIGFRGDSVVHELQQFVGECTNDALMALRQLVSKTFLFDPGDEHIFSAVKSIGLEHCFDPVLDMLSAAETSWDKKPRLYKWVITYLGCANTPLNRAISRKVLIAAVRRARKPGCKFDAITVLEGPEGTNKSTAISTLAGDDNFSDQKLLGASDKEIMEQLTGVWMHENADMAGMTRADVEQVKAFASRQVDRARPAYGRAVERRPRRSIEWGSTNSSEYLQSSDGNRRFWPLRTSTIDIDGLRRDRLQLLGEAAHYESMGETLLLGLWDKATEAQEARRIIDPWEELLREIPENMDFVKHKIVHRINDGIEGKLVVLTTHILTNVLNIPSEKQERRHSMRLSSVMKKLGWMRSDSGRMMIDGKQVYCYWRPDPNWKTPTEG
jgi:Virulence-associated protein E